MKYTTLFFVFFLNHFFYCNAQNVKIPKGGKIISSLNLENEKAEKIIGQLEKNGTQAKVIKTAYKSLDALEIKFEHQPSQPYEVQFNLPIRSNIKKGDVLLLSFYMRGIWSEDESGDVQIGTYLQKNKPPYTKFFWENYFATEEWRWIVTPFKVKSDLNKEQITLSVQLGYKPQIVQLAGIQLINFEKKYYADDLVYSKTTYAGRDINATWRVKAEERIKKIRKANVNINVIDKKGNPIKNAKVELNMVQHSFGFGTASNINQLTEDSFNGKKYREILAKYFNKTATEAGLRWLNWHNSDKNKLAENLKKLDESFNWLNQKGLKIRGHYIMWAPVGKGFQPEEYLNNQDSLKINYFEHIEEKLQWVGNRVEEWDVINHIIGWGKTYGSIYGTEIYKDVINKSRTLAPNQELWVNEGQILPVGKRISPYIKTIKYLQAQNAAPDGIGFMGHFREASLTPPERLYEIFDEFAEVIPNLQITELDVVVGLDEELQADYFRDVLIIAFSHPAMKGIVNWGFWEGRHWRKSGALWRKDWSIKPAGQVWLDYVYGKWWSNESGKSDAKGDIQMEVFKGEYEIIIKAKGKTIRKKIMIDKEEKFTLQF